MCFVQVDSCSMWLRDNHFACLARYRIQRVRHLTQKKNFFKKNFKNLYQNACVNRLKWKPNWMWRTLFDLLSAFGLLVFCQWEGICCWRLRNWVINAPLEMRLLLAISSFILCHCSWLSLSFDTWCFPSHFQTRWMSWGIRQADSWSMHAKQLLRFLLLMPHNRQLC